MEAGKYSIGHSAPSLWIKIIDQPGEKSNYHSLYSPECLFCAYI